MKRTKRSFRSLIALVRALRDQGALRPTQTDDIEKALKDLEHALSVRNLKRVESAVDSLSRAFVTSNREKRSDR